MYAFSSREIFAVKRQHKILGIRRFECISELNFVGVYACEYPSLLNVEQCICPDILQIVKQKNGQE